MNILSRHMGCWYFPLQKTFASSPSAPAVFILLGSCAAQRNTIVWFCVQLRPCAQCYCENRGCYVIVLKRGSFWGYQHRHTWLNLFSKNTLCLCFCQCDLVGWPLLWWSPLAGRGRTSLCNPRTLKMPGGGCPNTSGLMAASDLWGNSSTTAWR